MAVSQDTQPTPKSGVDEKLAGFDDIPLFMKSLPEDDSENTALSALQTLAHEGTPDGG
jgi:small subunit ribosomal protein S7e